MSEQLVPPSALNAGAVLLGSGLGSGIKNAMSAFIVSYLKEFEPSWESKIPLNGLCDWTFSRSLREVPVNLLYQAIVAHDPKEVISAIRDLVASEYLLAIGRPTGAVLEVSGKYRAFFLREWPRL